MLVQAQFATPMAPTMAAAAAAAPPASAPPATFGQDLSAALASARLSQYEAALRELGCKVTEDLAELEEQDLMEIGMKKIEAKRLQRMCLQ